MTTGPPRPSGVHGPAGQSCGKDRTFRPQQKAVVGGPRERRSGGRGLLVPSPSDPAPLGGFVRCRWRQPVPSLWAIGGGSAGSQRDTHTPVNTHGRGGPLAISGPYSVPLTGGLTTRKGGGHGPGGPRVGAVEHPREKFRRLPRGRRARPRPRLRRTQIFLAATIPVRPDAFRTGEEAEASSASTTTDHTDPLRPAWRFASVGIGKKVSAVALVTPYDSAALLVQSEGGTAGRRRVEL